MLTKKMIQDLNRMLGGEDGLNAFLEIKREANGDDYDEIIERDDGNIQFFDHIIIQPNQREQFILSLLDEPSLSTFSADQLYDYIRKEKYLNLSKKEVKRVMKEQFEPHSLHHRNPKNTNQTMLSYAFSLLEFDLVLLSRDSNSGLDAQGYQVRRKRPYEGNDGHLYILTCIDHLTKYAWAFPLKNKRPPTVSERLLALLDTFPLYRHTYSDNGSEFSSRAFLRALEERGVSHMFSKPYTPVSVIERFNRTLKSKIEAHFTKSGKKEWVEVLPRLLQSYNNGTTSVLPDKLTPREAFSICLHGSQERIDELEEKINNMRLNRYYKAVGKNKKMEELKENDYVRIRLKNVSFTRENQFKKGYKQQNTKDIYQVIKVYQPTRTKEMRFKVAKRYEFIQNTNNFFQYREVEEEPLTNLLFRDALIKVQPPKIGQLVDEEEINLIE